MTQKVSLIAALDEKRGLGKNNTLLFKIPRDFERLRKITTGHPIIMGRKTHESIGRVLPNRTNIIITRDTTYKVDGAIVAGSLEEALAQAQGQDGSEEIFLFGGGQVFKESMEKGLVDKLYLTLVQGDYHADTFFPDYSQFTKIISKEEHEEEGYKYTFLDLEK